MLLVMDYGVAMVTKERGMRNLVLFSFLLLNISTASAVVVTGNFVPGSGNTNLITNGGFDSSLAGWSQLNFGKGQFLYNSESVSGTGGSAQSSPYFGFSGPGFGLQSSAISVTAGQNYILSGFINTRNMISGQAYIDMSDTSFDINLGLDPTFGAVTIGLDTWQFLYAAFTPNVNSLRVRLVQDGFPVTAGSSVLFDNIAVTLASEFSEPIVSPVPVPAAAWLFMTGILGFWGLRKKTLS